MALVVGNADLRGFGGSPPIAPMGVDPAVSAALGKSGTAEVRGVIANLANLEHTSNELLRA